MRHRRKERFLVLWLIATPALGQSSEGAEFFEKNVRPIFAARCAQCHNEKLRSGGLDLTTPAGITAGPDSGSLVSKENPSDSRLLKAIGYEGKFKMPPDGKLPGKMIADLTVWTKFGAALPDYKPAAVAKTPTGVFSEARRNHWAFQPVRDYAPPVVKQPGWVQSPIDDFILAKLEEKGIAPPKPADKLTLIRRAKYDLLGLPPTDEEIRAFLGDNSKGAFEKVVDRFLASRSTAKNGDGTGWMWRVTRSRAASTITTPTPTHGDTANTSSMLSIAMYLTIV